MTLVDFVEWLYLQFYGTDVVSDVIDSVYSYYGIVDRTSLTFFQDMIINIYASLPIIITAFIVFILLLICVRFLWKIVFLGR